MSPYFIILIVLCVLAVLLAPHTLKAIRTQQNDTENIPVVGDRFYIPPGKEHDIRLQRKRSKLNEMGLDCFEVEKTEIGIVYEITNNQ